MAVRMTPDQTLIEQVWSHGIVRDRSRALIPDGGVYDAVDFMLEQPGKAYKRGGWLNHSAVLPAPPTMVASIRNPTRVVAISNDHVYDVTSEVTPEAIDAGSLGFTVGENPKEYVGKLIVCSSDGYGQVHK